MDWRTWDEEQKARAIKAFENHQIVKRSERGYLIQKPYPDGNGWESNLWAEVFCGFGAALYVGGDIEEMSFAYGPSDMRARIAWMGGNTSMSYVAEKAGIGGSKGVKVFKLAHARDTIDDMVRQHEKGGAAPLAVARLREAVAEVFRAHEFGEDSDVSQAFFYHELREATDPISPHIFEDFYNVGELPSPRLFTAWGALRKLHLLLVAEEERG